MTGFSSRVRKIVRTRAGSGHPEDATCEACGIWLGEYGGTIQHRLARGRGGSKNPVVASAANALLMCGLTPQDGCHGKAESRDPKHRMEARGFVIRHGVGPEFDPRCVSVELFGGVEVWLSDTEARYLYEPPIAGADKADAA